MNKTELLAKVLGIKPPHTVNKRLLSKISKGVLYELYLNAKLNKLEYTFLKSLEMAGIIGRYNFFKNKLDKKENEFLKFTNSVLNINEVLNEIGLKHTIIKTLYDFPVLPGDIDILIYEKINKDILELLKGKKFFLFDKGPHFISLYNSNIDNYFPRIKKSYDIDLYDEIALNYLVYLEKKYFIGIMKNATFRIKNDIDQKEYYVPTPRPEQELIIDLNHSLFEQLFTLFHFYVIMSLLDNLKVNDFLNLAHETKSLNIVKFSLKIFLKIFQGLMDKNVSKNTISKIDYIASSVGLSLNDDINKKNYPRLPYRFTIRQLITVMSEKTLVNEFNKGILLLLLNTLNPKMGNHIIYHLSIRRKRYTY